MVAAPIVLAAVAWRIRSGQVAAKVAAGATAIGWACTVFLEWLLSFALGAG